MLKGKRLEKGDTIGIVAPANFGSKDEILKSKKQLEILGYKVKLGEHIFDIWYSFAGVDKNRILDINNFFKDPEVDAIMCLRGGYGSLNIVENLDIKTIKTNPKIFIGYSDITTLHIVLNQRANLITFHGPMAISNFLNVDKITLNSFIESVEGKKSWVLKNVEPLKCMVDGVASGVVVGGNLITILSSIGTPNEINLEDKILFIEEIREPTYKIDRALTQLLNTGKLFKLKGIILGEFSSCDPSSEYDIPLIDVLENKLKRLKIPIIYNLKSGHCKPMITLPLGVKVEINTKKLTIKILEGVVK